MVNFAAAADVDCLVLIVKRKLKKLQYRTLIDGYLAGTGLTVEPW